MEIKDKFVIGGEYALEGRFADVCSLEKRRHQLFLLLSPATRFGRGDTRNASFARGIFLGTPTRDDLHLCSILFGSLKALSDV